MKKVFLLTLLIMVSLLGAKAQIIYEDFESGAALNWTAVDGTFNGVIANPAPDAVCGLLFYPVNL